MYAAVCEGLDPEQRAEIDRQLLLPIGMTKDSREDAVKAWRRSRGLQN